MQNYIYNNPNSLSEKNCQKIIGLFENEINTKYEGITQSGLNKQIKNTTDYVINPNDTKWTDIYNTLSLELQTNIKLYLNQLHENSFDEKYRYFKDKNLITENFMIQRYIKNHGKYIYHNDFAMNNGNPRVITFLWYLNTIEEGGETEFWGNYKIKPEQGKLIFFPALWCYPHCGNIPLSDNKYIITGWLYEHFSQPNSTEIQDKFIQRYMYDNYFTDTECEWLINEITKYYSNNKNESNDISFELITTTNNYMLIKIKKILDKIKDFYCLTNINIIKLSFIRSENIDDVKNIDDVEHKKNILKFFIPLSENIEFYMNDNTTKKNISGNLFLFSDKKVNYKLKCKYYVYGLIESI
jgi:hypothetical protein